MKTLLALLFVLSSAAVLHAQSPQLTSDSCAYSPFSTSFEEVIRGGNGHDTLFFENPFGFPVRIDSITVNTPFTLEHFTFPIALGPHDGVSGAITVITPDTGSADYDLNGTIRVYAYSDSAQCVPNVKPIHIHVLAHDNTNVPLNINGFTTAQAHLDSKTDTRRLTIVNNAADPVRVDSVVFDAGSRWSIAGISRMPKQLSAHDTLNVDVRFIAPADGMYKGNLIIFTSNVQRHYIGLWYVVKTLAGIARVVQSEPSLQISPNPSTSEAHVRFVSAEAENARLTIYDGLGRTMLELGEKLATGENTLTLATTSLPAGTYNCILHTAKVQAAARLLIVR